MAIMHSEPGVEAALVRARVVVETLDEALATLDAGVPTLPPVRGQALPASLAARLRQALLEVEAQLATLEREYEEVAEAARSWQERVALAGAQGRADLVAHAEGRRAKQVELAALLAAEVGQLRAVRDRAAGLLANDPAGGRRADV